MGAAGDLRAHQRIFRVKCICVDSLQIVASCIVIPVAGGTVEMLCTDSVFLHRSEHFQLVGFGSLIELRESILQRIADLFTQILYLL